MRCVPCGHVLCTQCALQIYLKYAQSIPVYTYGTLDAVTLDMTDAERAMRTVTQIIGHECRYTDTLVPGQSVKWIGHLWQRNWWLNGFVCIDRARHRCIALIMHRMRRARLFIANGQRCLVLVAGRAGRSSLTLCCKNATHWHELVLLLHDACGPFATENCCIRYVRVYANNARCNALAWTNAMMSVNHRIDENQSKRSG